MSPPAASPAPDPDRLGGLGWLERTGGALTRRQRAALIPAVLAAHRDLLVTQARLLGSRRPRALDGLVLPAAPPDSALCRAAQAACAAALPPALVGHSARPWWYGRVLAGLDWWDQHRQPQASRTGTAPPATPQRPQTLQLRCAQPCWLEARDVKTGRRVYYNTLKGSTTLPIGSGLEVFSGRADVLKIRINAGPEQRFSTIMVGKRTFMPTTFMPTPR